MVLVPVVQPDGLHSVYTRTLVLFHKGELVLLSGDAEMLLRRPGINRRVFREGIIIGDLNRSFSSLIDSSSEVGPGRPFPGRLPSILTLRRGGRDGIQRRRRNWFLICFTAGREMKTRSLALARVFPAPRTHNDNQSHNISIGAR